MAFGALGLLVALRRVLIAVSDAARRADARIRQRLNAAAHRMHLNDPSVLGSVLLMLSAYALVGAWLHFSPLSGALFSDFSTAPAATLRLIAPVVDGSPNLYNNSYRKTFSWIVILTTLLWYLVLRLSARKGERLHAGLLAGAAATIVLALASLDYPFRLFNNLGTQFDAARWQSQDCYILGERRDDVLLFCPALEPTRHRIVKNTDPTLQRTGVRESIFTRFSQTP
jgi:hypothetical protein